MHIQDPLKGRHPLKPPVLIIGLRQIAELHKHIDKADVSLLLQQLGGDRAECSLKVLPIPCHGLCHSLRHRLDSPRTRDALPVEVMPHSFILSTCCFSTWNCASCTPVTRSMTSHPIDSCKRPSITST